MYMARFRPLTNIARIIVHCADTPSKMDIGAKEIREWHKKRGWLDIGYHFVIRRNGEIEPGRPITAVGAHTLGMNRHSIGICLAGGRPPGDFTDEQYVALATLVLELSRRYHWPEVVGHRDCILSGNPPKSCPTFDVKEWWSRDLEIDMEYVKDLNLGE